VISIQYLMRWEMGDGRWDEDEDEGGFVRFWTKLGGDFWWGVLGWGGKRLIWRGLRWVGV